MKFDLRYVLSLLGGAWDALIDAPVPRFLGRCDQQDEALPAAFPVFGWLGGLMIWLVSLVIAGIFNRIAGGVVAAIAAWLVLTLKDSGRGDLALLRQLGAKLPVADNAATGMLPAMLRLLLLLLMTLGGNARFLPFLFGGAFGLQAVLALHDTCTASLLSATERSKRIFAVTAAILALVSFCCCRLGCALGAVVLLLIYQRFTSRQDEGLTPEAISRAGAVAEWALIGCGVLSL